MRGRYVSLSPGRRLVADYMWFSRDLPLVTIERRVDLARLIDVRKRAVERPIWAAVFAKAFAIVCMEDPRLRRAYVKLPWPCFFEYASPVASIILEREHDGEETLLSALVKSPETLPLSGISQSVRQLAASPVAEVREFSRMLRVARLPRPLRRMIWWSVLNWGRLRANYFGTFLLTSLMSEKAISKRILSPLPVILTYGVLDADGSIEVRMTFDHRVMDGRVAARALSRLEQVLNGSIADEIAAQSA
jgi:hypothetical protein